MSAGKPTPQCEGNIRIGEPPRLGPPRWRRCQSPATRRVTVKQGSKFRADSLACDECYAAGIAAGVKYLKVKPLKKPKNV